MTSLNNQRGAVLITALIVLVLLTIIGIAATNTSTLETMISATERNRIQAFHTAEAGIEHIRRNFKGLYSQYNANKAPALHSWNFALAGPIDSDPDTGPATGQSYQEGALWIKAGDLNNNYTYNVTVWNNNDGGSATSDTDGLIFVRADAQVPGGGTASIEILLEGTTTPGSTLNDNTAQEGGGAGKNFGSNDIGTVDLSTVQIQ